MVRRRHQILVSISLFLALLLPGAPARLVYADGPSRPETVHAPTHVVIEVKDEGFNGQPDDFTIEVEEGQLVELTFVWSHVGWVEEEHIMVLEGYDLEWDQIDFHNREATQQFIADKPGTFDFKCDLDCEVHDILQRGHLKVRRSGAAPVAAAVPADSSATTTTSGSSTDGRGAPAASASSPQGSGAPVASVPSTESLSAPATPTPTQSTPPPAAPAASSLYRATTLSVSPSSWATSGEPVSLMAVLRDNKEAPVSKAELRFLMDAEFGGTKGKMELRSVKTDANGVAFFDYRPTIAAKSYVITVRFEGKGIYDESESAIELRGLGAPPPAYTMEPIGLEAVRKWAPLALAVVILGFWSLFGFVLYRAVGIAWVRARR